MKFKYSICYPDKDEIDFIDTPILSDEIFSLIKEFDWDSELEKEIHYYAPGLDFIKLLDKHRIIFSGIGDGKLGSFQVMYIVPNALSFQNVFDERHYRNTDSYTSEVSIEKGYELLQNFIDGEYGSISKALKKDISFEELKEINPNLIIKDYEHIPLEPLDEAKKRSFLEKMNIRIAVPLISFIVLLMVLGFYKLTGNLTEDVYVFSSLFLVFVLGPMLFEILFLKK